ncbi:MAG: excinuclease ABC subunit UvrA [Verrucomicrobia bacterium]|nr:MAG: excinuclease ABC subunit UvrA [Verrucomicrobiota bacterium]PYK50904.1 MAG: excinuclease ABC subunit UvrA [Verrucomicrobiota bacterium]
MPAQVIKISGARQHNLKNLHVEIPREKLVVITGLSGSGKSSLAFDTLYAEGQRRYVESLSAYARQFLDQMEKPNVDFIQGLSPAIAIEQRSAGANPRSTIATTTEIYDYLRVLFSAVGQPHDPLTGRPLSRQTPQQIVDQILAYEVGSKIIVLAPLIENQPGEFRDVIEKLRREGFVRARIDGQLIELDRPEPIRLNKNRRHRIEAVVDRLIIRHGIRVRLTDSIETALKLGGNNVSVLRSTQKPPNSQHPTSNTESEQWEELRYSTDYGNAETGFTLGDLTPRHFSFNSHLGACPACHGLGTQLVCDPDLMISDPGRTLAEGAITPWRRGTKRMQAYYRHLQKALVKHFQVDEDVPFSDLPVQFKQALYFGTNGTPIEMSFSENGEQKVAKPFEGLVPQMQRLYEQTQSEFTRNRIRSFMTREPCKVCNGARLKPEILGVTIKDRNACELNIHQFSELTIEAAAGFISDLELSAHQQVIVNDVVREIQSRLQFLVEVGLGYLTLNRQSGTLSGGEAQRIRLATQIGSGLAGVLYILDEPSIGLHQRDNGRLLGTLRRLRDLGNSVIVVEHDEETIRAADHIIDLGPGAGPRGGEIVAQGKLNDILSAKNSLTGDYLSGRARIPVPSQRTKPRLGNQSEGWLTLVGATENNLKDITVSFPLGCLTCVTGVSGSGKSTLVDDILRRALFRRFYNAKQKPGAHRAIRGVEQIDKAIVIDQSAIGRTPRSNPVTYTGAFTPIRELLSQLPASRVRGYDAGRFSFNVKGGRCENCEGGGLIKIEMHFLPDVYVECEVCHGKRYNRETLEITYKGKNIADVLDLTVDQAARFFRNVPSISEKLNSLLDVGLGYLRLGQGGTTLSGGEAQRVKLATELAKKATGRTLYILDEPTTGLHFADIEKLLQVLMKLRNAGNTVIVIEHNLQMIKCADWIIDLGPEGGEAGGYLVGAGPPEQIAALPSSHTGQYLQPMLEKR